MPLRPLTSLLACPARFSPSSRLLAPTSTRTLSSLAPPAPQRSYLYVPGSSPPARLTKALSNGLAGASGRGQPDVLILDLEDSVRTENKGKARDAVVQALKDAPSDCRSQKYVRINSGKLGFDDLSSVLSAPKLDGLVLPKVNTADDLRAVDEFISRIGSEENRGDKLKLVVSIESPLGLLNMREIIGVSKRIGALLFAAEDYTASSFLTRTPSLSTFLHARQSLVAHARAFHLNAIDLVCVQYKGEEAMRVLREEARGGREMGFGGKQCIHPGQVEEVNKAFAPGEEEIDRALRILAEYEKARSSGAGAYGLEEKGGGTVMIDSPMLLQAESILAQARTAGLLT